MTINMYMKDVVTDLHATAKSPFPLLFFYPSPFIFPFFKKSYILFFFGEGGVICSLYLFAFFFTQIFQGKSHHDTNLNTRSTREITVFALLKSLPIIILKLYLQSRSSRS